MSKINFKLRSVSRFIAFQTLFQEEINPSEARGWNDTLVECADEQCADMSVDERSAVLDYARRLVEAALEHREEIDGIVSSAFDRNRTMARTMRIDRNILRLATCEMVYLKTPAPVVISEAMQLGIKFGDKGSRAFLNGVLDQVGKLCARGIDNLVEKNENAKPAAEPDPVANGQTDEEPKGDVE